MARVDVNQLDLLEAIVAHYRNDAATINLHATRVILTSDPLSVRIPKGGDWWLAVSAGEGTFPQDLLTGGVVEQCTEDGSFQVTGYLRCHLDPTDSDEQTLIREARGLMEIKRKILKSMAGVDLQVGGNECLRELITPRSSVAPRIMEVVGDDAGDENLRIALVGVVFSLMFDWDLS